MTIEEAAEYLRFHPSTVRRLARQKVIPAVKVGKQWRVHRGTLDDWVQEQSRGGRQAGSNRRNGSLSPASERGESLAREY